MSELMYSEIASWWPILSPPSEYEEEAAFYAATLIEACDERPQTVLELGAGGGNNAWHMKKEFEMTLTELSPAMLEVSKKLNSDCEHLVADMRTLRLDRTFDAVFIHDAIGYMLSAGDLAAAVETAFVHTRAGGAALFCPDHVKDHFEESTDHGGSDADGRGLRFLQWSSDPDPSDSLQTTDYAYLLRERDGSVRMLHDQHLNGLFSLDEWHDILASAGFTPSHLVFDHSEVDYELVVLVGRKPA